MVSNFRRWWLLLLFGISQLIALKAEVVNVRFYSEQIQINYHPGMISNSTLRYNENEIIQYYRSMLDAPFQPFLQSLEAQRHKLGLNDWFYYELLQRTLEEILQDGPKLQKTLMTWFLLSKAGFDTRLTYIKQKAFVYVYSADAVFEVPMIEEGGRTYINLSSLSTKENGNYAEAVYLLNFAPNKKGRSFGFYLKGLPSLRPEIQNKQISFSQGNSNYQLNVKVDLNLIEMMKNYPIIDEQKYFEVPLSDPIYSSLIPQLRKIIANRSQNEALQTLVSFTRSAFQYKEDQDYFGKSKPMISDEVLHYPYSDCEDRSALFYSLVKELLELPMIIIAYPDHLTVGVATKEALGKPIAFQGRNFYVCDPTGPYNSAEIGDAPAEYAKSAYEILGFHK